MLDGGIISQSICMSNHHIYSLTICSFIFQLHLGKAGEKKLSRGRALEQKGKKKVVYFSDSHILQFHLINKNNNKLGSQGEKGEHCFNLIFSNCFNIYKILP